MVRQLRACRPQQKSVVTAELPGSQGKFLNGQHGVHIPPHRRSTRCRPHLCRLRSAECSFSERSLTPMGTARWVHRRDRLGEYLC